MRIMGIDQNTHTSGFVIVDLSLNENGEEVIKVVYSGFPINAKRSKKLQERLYEKSSHLRKGMHKILSEYKPDIVIREEINPRGSSSNQINMVNGILDAYFFSKKYSFLNGKYKRITPVEWRNIIIPNFPRFKKTTIKTKKEYCQIFIDNLSERNIEGFEKIFHDADLLDAFGMAYACSVGMMAGENEKYRESLGEIPARLIVSRKTGELKKWD